MIRTPARAPNANAHAERWVRTIRADFLDRILIVGRRHLAHVLRVYRRHSTSTGPPRAPPATTRRPVRRPRPDAADRACRPSSSRSPRRTHPRIRRCLSLRTLRDSRGGYAGTELADRLVGPAMLKAHHDAHLQRRPGQPGRSFVGRAPFPGDSVPDHDPRGVASSRFFEHVAPRFRIDPCHDRATRSLAKQQKSRYAGLFLWAVLGSNQ